MNILLVLLASIFLFTGCNKVEGPVIIDSTESVVSGEGAFIINEGNFRMGNGSLSFYSYDSLKMHNDIFRKITGRPLGDVPNSMEICGDKVYIVVNNSGKIEIAEKNTLKSINTISSLNSPRYLAIINTTKAYVTSMYSDSLVIVNLQDYSVSGFIDLNHTSESIVVSGSKAFVANWIGGDKVMVINTSTDMLTDSITVAKEPESMVLDKNNTLWVLCNGGWNRTKCAELIGIDVQNYTIKKKFVFPTLTDSPTCLKIDGNGEKLFYLSGGIMMLDIEALSLPGQAFIEEGTHLFYKLGINPVSGEIFVTDAVDYQQKGYVMRYDKAGQLLTTVLAGIIPGEICFKVMPNPVIE